jgi:hypothetical protein
MKLSIKALALTAALLWGGALLVVGIANQVCPPYGAEFLTIMGSIYPGYQPGTGITSIIVGTLYALVDGGVGGAIFAWLYNLLV